MSFWIKIICNPKQWPEPFANTNCCWLKAEYRIVKVFPGRNLICGNVLHRNCDEVCSWQNGMTMWLHRPPSTLWLQNWNSHENDSAKEMMAQNTDLAFFFSLTSPQPKIWQQKLMRVYVPFLRACIFQKLLFNDVTVLSYI